MVQRSFRTLVVAFVLLLSLGAARFDQGQQPSPSALEGARTSATPLTSPTAATTEEQQISEGDVLRIDSNLVTVPASVMDRQGRYVADLRKEDFEIFEDGVEQRISFFASVERPFTTLMLLDVSGSMTYQLDELGRAANAFVSQLRQDDQLSAFAFADFPWVLIPTTRVGDLRTGIKLRQRTDQQGTMLYDAVDYALKRMKKIQGRKAIVLFSDGFGSGIISSAKRNLRDAEELDALIYPVQFDTAPAKPPSYLNRKQYLKGIDEANSYMRNLAQRTGGRYYHIEDLSDLERTFGLIADELRRQYSLGYYPKTRLEAGQRREIKVRVDRPDLVVRARDSYIVDKDRLRGKN